MEEVADVVASPLMLESRGEVDTGVRVINSEVVELARIDRVASALLLEDTGELDRIDEVASALALEDTGELDT